MQISLTQNQITDLKNNHNRNLNESASVDHSEASNYYDVYKIVGETGFNQFLTTYYGFDAKQVERAKLRSQARQMFPSRRTWMRVGGYKGIKMLMSLKVVLT